MTDISTTAPHFAGFWIRVGASLIDGILNALIVFPVLVSIYGIEYFDSDGSFQGPMDFLLTFTLPMIGTILFWRYKSATPGKMAVAVRLVDATTGQPPSVGQCIGRYLAYFIAALPLGLGILWVAFDRRKQGWHDKLSGTVVVRRND